MINKSLIIQALEEMAILMELKGVNPFKARAFSNASRILQGYTGNFDQLVREKNITDIKGIGQGIASFITEIATTGLSEELTQLKNEIPAGVLEMLKIPGLGPKKAKTLWENLNIKSIGELEYACLENRLIDLSGFGIKSQEKIQKGIEQVKKYSNLHLISHIRIEADKLYQSLKNFPGVHRCELAGSLRRWKETAKDIDIVISIKPNDRDKIIQFFVTHPEIETITGKGQTKCNGTLKSGINVDLRLVSDAEFPYALHYFTGSKEHNVALREVAKKLDLKINEYGLFDVADKNIDCEDESEIFMQLGLSYIAPEMRENYGELEAAGINALPDLVSMKDIRGVIHVHSTHSDGLNTLEELAGTAQNLGYEYLVISDHSKSAIYANGLTEERIIKQFEEIDTLNKSLKNFKIFKSIECDILMDGNLDYSDDILQLFDLVIISIHSRFQMTESQATERMLKAMENPYVTIIGHPTGRLLLAREGYPIDMNTIIDAAAARQISVELNANPHRLDIDWRLLKHAKEKGVKISINPDAHRIEGFNDIQYGIGIARKGWLSPVDVLNTHTAQQFQKFIDTRKP
jgi:DNA polymerase (family 10)